LKRLKNVQRRTKTSKSVSTRRQFSIVRRDEV
jgi:hypothetical protein